MSNKTIGRMMLIACASLLLLGCIVKFVFAESQKGTYVQTGIKVNGEYITSSAGYMGGSQKKAAELNMYGNVLLCLGAAAGAAGGFITIQDKKNAESEEETTQ